MAYLNHQIRTGGLTGAPASDPMKSGDVGWLVSEFAAAKVGPELLRLIGLAGLIGLGLAGLGLSGL